MTQSNHILAILAFLSIGNFKD